MRNPRSSLHWRCDSCRDWSRAGGSSSFNASPGLREPIKHISSYLASVVCTKVPSSRRISATISFRREGEAEGDADGADFVCRPVAKDHYISPFVVFNRLNCVVLVGNIMTFLATVLWLNKYQYLLTEEDVGKTMFPACGCQPNVSRSLKHD